MESYDPPSPNNDPFGPPAIPTLVCCLHCGQEYDSYHIEWRFETNAQGRSHGFWCCPIAGCDGKGFGFDILPVDPDYQDEYGGWVHDDEDADEEEPFPEVAGTKGQPGEAKDEDIPW